LDRWQRIALLLAFGALVYVTGCGGAAEETAPPAPAPEEARPAPGEDRGSSEESRTVAEPVRKPKIRTAPVRADPPERSAPAGVDVNPPSESEAPDTTQSEPPPQATPRTSGSRSEVRNPGARRPDRARPNRPGSSSSAASSKSTSAGKNATSSGAPLVALGGAPTGLQRVIPLEPDVSDPGSSDEAAKPRTPGGAAPPPPPPLPIEDQDSNVDPTPEPPDPLTVVEVVLQPNMLDVAPGSALSFHIWIYGAEDVASVPFHLLFNPEVLAFQGAHEGPFLAGDGTATVFMFAGGSGGQSVVVGHSRLSRDTGANGTGELCVLNFVALAEGDPGLAFDRAKVIDVTGRDQLSLFQVQPLVIR